MKTVKHVAAAFVAGDTAKCHNAYTDGWTYWLHGHPIAKRYDRGDYPFNLTLNWCGWYTPTTTNHLNAIAKAVGARGVSYSQARAAGVKHFLFKAVA